MIERDRETEIGRGIPGKSIPFLYQHHRPQLTKIIHVQPGTASRYRGRNVRPPTPAAI